MSGEYIFVFIVLGSIRKYLLNEESRWYDFNFTNEEAEAQGSRGRIFATVVISSVPDPC